VCNINNNNNDNSDNDNDNYNIYKNNINNIKIHYCGGMGQFSCCLHIKEGEQDGRRVKAFGLAFTSTQSRETVP
jgi:hypothetical protein